MFCNQCEQAKHGVGCDLVAICGKPPEVSDLFDLLLWQLKGLATVHEKARTAGTADPAVDRFLIEGLFITVTNVNFDVDRVVDFVRQADAMTDSAVAAAGVDREDPALPEPVRFRTEGLGTTFEICLPQGRMDLASAPPDRSALRPESESSFLKQLSILVIDDEHDVRDGMQTVLLQHGCDVIVADSAEQACNYIITNNWVPQLIVADYRLRDDKTGDMAIEQVREEVNMDVPAMIITGDTSPVRLREATASGFPLLHKPVVAEDLLNAIARLVGECK